MKIKQYSEYGVRFAGDDKAIQYLVKNRDIIKGRPQSFQHGDYHIENMIMEDGRHKRRDIKWEDNGQATGASIIGEQYEKMCFLQAYGIIGTIYGKQAEYGKTRVAADSIGGHPLFHLYHDRIDLFGLSHAVFVDLIAVDFGAFDELAVDVQAMPFPLSRFAAARVAGYQ